MFASKISQRAFVFGRLQLRKAAAVAARDPFAAVQGSNRCSPVPTTTASVATVTTARCFSSSTSSSDLVLTTINTDSGVATLTMNQPPVNSLNLEMCQAISSAIRQVEDTYAGKIQSLVLASSRPGIFCAGLDIMEMHNPDEQRLEEFWHSFQQLYLDLYGSNLATIAAIAGHAPAAGCMLALSCDYRIMMTTEDDDNSSGPSPTIGLNETKLGIVAPPWLGQQFIDTVGQRQAELGLSLGLLYSPEQAKEIGLVDELVVGVDDVLTRAQQEAAKWGQIPPKARFGSKMLGRKQRLDHLIENRQNDNDYFRSFVLDDQVQQTIDSYLQSLVSKKKNEEQRKIAEAKRKEEELKRIVEAKKLEEEAIKREEEQSRLALEEERKLVEEERRLAVERRKEEDLKRVAEAKRKEEELERQRVAEEKKQEEERKRLAVEEQSRVEEEQRLVAEEQKKKEDLKRTAKRKKGRGTRT